MVNSKWVNSAQVFYEEGNESRWIDARGINVVKAILAPGSPCDDGTGDPTRFTVTVTEAGGGGDSTIVNSATINQLLLLTTDNADYDGLNVQLKGEAFKLSASKPLYFGIRCLISDATQSDFLVGLCETHGDLVKTGVAHGIAAADVEGVFFFKVDAGTTIAAKTYLNGAETATANCATAMDTSLHTYEIVWDGTTVYFFVDSILVTSVAASLPDGDLTPSINFRTGENVAKSMRVAWMRTIQINY
jgi:hypothetical protein